MRTDCFAYRKEKNKLEDFEWIREYCDALEEPHCTGCRFYKHKDSVKMKVVRKQVRYEDIK